MPFGHQVYQTRKLHCNHSIPFLNKSIISLLQYFLQTLWSCWNILEPGIINYLMNSALVNHYWVYEGPLFHCHRRCVGSFHWSGILHSEASFGWSEVRWAQLDFTCWKFLSYGGEVNSLDYHQVGFFPVFFFNMFFFKGKVGGPCGRWTFSFESPKLWAKAERAGAFVNHWTFESSQFRRPWARFHDGLLMGLFIIDVSSWM